MDNVVAQALLNPLVLSIFLERGGVSICYLMRKYQVSFQQAEKLAIEIKNRLEVNCGG